MYIFRVFVYTSLRKKRSSNVVIGKRSVLDRGCMNEHVAEGSETEQDSAFNQGGANETHAAEQNCGAFNT